MKLITAVVKPHKVTEVKDALRNEGVAGMTVSEVQGFGRQSGHTDVYRGTEYVVEFVPKMMVQAVVDDAMVDNVITAIINSAITNTIGDGKIWVTDVERLVRIRTGEVDEAAL